jgi:hypothetical protein
MAATAVSIMEAATPAADGLANKNCTPTSLVRMFYLPCIRIAYCSAE